MRDSLTVIFAAGVLCGSTAGVAQTPETNTAQSKPASKEKTYCLKSTGDSGSNLRRVECRTKKEWAEEGVDVDKLLKR